jgi:predicted amidohydrolase YtcJ
MTIDLILVGGRVRTLDPATPSATALAVADGRLAYVGDDAGATALREGATEVIDLKGAAVTPGLVDSHIHPFMGRLFQGGIDLMDARTLDDVRAQVAAAARGCRPGEWLTGFGLDYNMFAETGIHGSLLAEAAGEVPTMINFVDMHTAIATPRAMALAGVDGPRTFDEHAEVVCEDGVPTGQLREQAAVRLVTGAMPPMTAAQVYEKAVEVFERLNAVGVTGVHSMDGDLPRLDLLRELEANGDLKVRVTTPFWLKPETTRDEWEAYAAAGGERGVRWRGGVAKFFIDGVIDSGTGWLFTPDSEGGGLEPFWPDPGLYREAVAYMTAAGLQCVTHCCGDRAVREALDAYREAGRPPGLKHRIEHIETIQAEDIPRFAAEGVIASMQAQHMMWLEPDQTDNFTERLGPDRCSRAFMTRSLLESGAELTLGSDWPVARLDPREGMAAARLRRVPGMPEREPFDDEGISALDALLGYTAWPVRTRGESAEGGSIEVGKRADLAAFAVDPVECDADALIEDEVLLTVVEGEIVHRSID